MGNPLFEQFCEVIREEMAHLHIPGVAVGILDGDACNTAGFGVTNVEHPLPVDANTLFQIGSISKTITATAAMHMVEAGRLDLDAPLRRYLPELRLADEAVAAQVTAHHLFTHTAGWAGDYFADGGPGDDALAKVVATLAELPQVSPLGRYWSYNNAAFYLAGRLLEVLEGRSFEALARDLVLDPLGMRMSFFAAADCITHAVAAGHQAIYGDDPDGGKRAPVVARPWGLPRAIGPMGGIISTVNDLLRYARFQMGDGTGVGASEGAATAGSASERETPGEARRLLAPGSLAFMHTPYVPAANGEWMGLAWFIRSVPGRGGENVCVIRHGGGTKGQLSTIQFAPARRFAVVILTNSQRGDELTAHAVRWALEHYLGAHEVEPVAQPATAEELAPYAGRYRALGEDLVLRVVEGGRLLVEFVPLGGFPTPDTPPLPAPPPVRAALMKVGQGGGDGLLLLDEPAIGQQGEFLRDVSGGDIAWLRLGGRLHARVS
jgi:CubicO group peptidase (beta-lactamase class C family)